MKDIIIGSITKYDYDVLRPWINSLNRCGFTGRKILFCYNISQHVIDKINQENIETIKIDRSIDSIVVDRFWDYWNFLKDVEGRYVISTDVKDLIFQKNPSEWLEANMQGFDINASSESVTYENENWGNRNLLSSFGSEIHSHIKQNVINNAGVISGRIETVRDIFLQILLISRGSSISNPDQAAYNLLLSSKPIKSVTRFTKSEEAWAAQLGTTKCPLRLSQYGHLVLEPEPIMKDNLVCNSQGEPFCIVHQYDRIPEWKEIITERYQ